MQIFLNAFIPVFKVASEFVKNDVQKNLSEAHYSFDYSVQVYVFHGQIYIMFLKVFTIILWVFVDTAYIATGLCQSQLPTYWAEQKTRITLVCLSRSCTTLILFIRKRHWYSINLCKGKYVVSLPFYEDKQCPDQELSPNQRIGNLSEILRKGCACGFLCIGIGHILTVLSGLLPLKSDSIYCRDLTVSMVRQSLLLCTS